jgi:peptidoglycan-N-acetylglucosamine deacetylase
MRALALTLDLDGPAEYAGIHGLEPGHCEPLLMYGGPLARFIELCREVGGKGTLFAIGRDVHDEAARALRQASKVGFEIGNHSFAHDYALSRRSLPEVCADLRRAQATLADEAGVLPVGMRAPGYHLSPALFDAAEEVGLAYDSSLLPSPSYYAVKAGVLALYRLAGKRSISILGPPATLLAPTTPYRPGHEPWTVGEPHLIELPIAVATPARLPITGASLLLAPSPLRALLIRALAAVPVLVINLHAMDLVDARPDGLPSDIAKRQPELRRPLEERRRILREALTQLALGRELLTCAEIAKSAAT